MSSSNCVFGFPIYSDQRFSPVLSGGSFLAGLPLANVLDTRLRKVARSTDATTGSTQFDIDLGVARALRVFAILLPNATAAATVRIRLSNSAGSFGSPVYDSTALVVLPALSAEQLEGLNAWKTIVASADQSARYARVEVNDTANPDGYVDFALAILAAGWQPAYNFAVGATLGWESGTVRSETDGFTATFKVKPSRRATRFTVHDLADTDAFGSAFDLQRLAGLHRLVHFVTDPTDTTHMHRRSFPGTLRQLIPLEYLTGGHKDVPWEIVEHL
jgi:hypothetical protein